MGSSHCKPKPYRRLLPLWSLVLPLLVGGCQATESAVNGLRENEVLRNAARGVLMGKAYDRAVIAHRNHDNQALKNATDELKKFDPQTEKELLVQPKLKLAESLVERAQNLDLLASKAKDSEKKRQFTEQATQKYREALQISPEFPSKNPELLNSLGYFLADRGNTKKDFQDAEKLTRQSLKQWDGMLAELEKVPLSEKARTQVQFFRALTAQDSLAWALFRQGKLEEAAREQQDVLNTAERTAPLVNEKISAELYYHYAEIERARGNTSNARANYQKALRLEPDHKPSLEALRSLPASKVPVPHPSPSQPENDTQPLKPGVQLT